MRTSTARITDQGMVPAVLDAASGAVLTVPDGFSLADAAYSRLGPNLVIDGRDGTQVVVADFFAVKQAPSLVSPAGTVMPGDMAARLAGSPAPGQYAQAATQATDAAPAGPAPIGEVNKLSGIAQIRHADGTSEAASNGMAVYEGDVVTTGSKGSVGIVFVDGSTFSVGNSARAVLEQLSYDPATNTGTSTLQVTTGPFSFVSGEIAKTTPDAMTVKTPVLTIGVRGTTVAGVAAPEGGNNTVSLLADSGGSIGQIAVKSGGGVQVMSQINQTVQLTSFNQPPPPPVIVPVQQIQQLYGSATVSLPPAQPPLQQRTEPPASPQMRQQQQQLQQKSEAAKAAPPAEAAKAAADAKAAAAAKVQGEAAKAGVAAPPAGPEGQPQAPVGPQGPQGPVGPAGGAQLGPSGPLGATTPFGPAGLAAQGIMTALGGMNSLTGPNPLGMTGDQGIGQVIGQVVDAIGEQLNQSLSGIFGPQDSTQQFAQQLAQLQQDITQQVHTIIQQQIQNQVQNIVQQAQSQPTTVHQLTFGSVTITPTSGVNDHIQGTIQNNHVTISGAMGAGDGFIDMSTTDSDTLVLSSGPNVFRVGRVEAVDMSSTTSSNSLAVGSDGSMTITLGSYADSIVSSQFADYPGYQDTGNQTWTLVGLLGTNSHADAIDMGIGTDTLSLQTAGTHAVTLTAVEAVTLANGSNSLTFSTPVTGLAVTGGSGTDIVTLSGAGNSLTVSSIETVIGSSGSDSVVLASGGQVVTVSAVELLTGGSGDDTVNMSGSGSSSINGGNGNDILSYADSSFSAGMTVVMDSTNGNSITHHTSVTDTFSNIESLTTSTGTDSITLNSGTSLAYIDSGSGTDTVTWSYGSSNISTTISHAETVTLTGTGTFTASVSGSSAVTVSQGSSGPLVLTVATATASVNGGTGTDKVTLSDATHSLTVTSVESITGGTGDDSVTIAASLSGGSINLGSGTDMVTFSAATNSATISNVDTIIGGGGVDTMTISTGGVTFIGGAGADVVNLATGGGAGTDVVRYNLTSQVGDNVNYFTQGTDKISFASAQFTHTNGTDLGGGAYLLNASDFATVTGANTESASVHFIYNSDTGNLYYDADTGTASSSVVVAHLASDSGATAVSGLTETDIHFS